MNFASRGFVGIGAALLLFVEFGHAQTAVWTNGFEGSDGSRWVSSAPWNITSPTAGPPLDSSGARAFSGTACATTQHYLNNQDGRIYCTSYLNGSNTLVVPPASQSPTLTFESWYSLANALAYVEIFTASNGWHQIGPARLNLTTGTQWAQESIDLSAYAGQSVQFGFHFASGGCCGNGLGWDFDNVAVTVTITNPPTVVVPPTTVVYAGQTLQLQISATNRAVPDAVYSFRLLSGPRNAALSDGGVLTWPTTATQPSTNVTFVVAATDRNNVPQLTASNSFTVTLINPWMPQLSGPSSTNIYAGQSLTLTASVTNTFFPDDTFTFTLLTNGLPNPDLSDLADGVVMWNGADTMVAGTYTNFLVVTDDFPPNYSATNQFVIVISNPPPPVLIVPGTQTVYAGQPLTVTNTVTDVAFPDGPFTFMLLSPTTGMDLSGLETDGVLTWMSLPTNKISFKTITLSVSDETSGLSATNSFQVVISPTPPPSIIVPGVVTNHAGLTLTVTNFATNVVFPDATFTFSLAAASTNVVLTTNGVLTWTNTGVKNGVLIWTNNSVAPKTNVIFVTVNTFIAGSPAAVPLLATNHFDIVFLPPLPPTFVSPTNPSVVAGLRATNTLAATNPVAPASVFTFALASPSTNVVVQTNGVWIWTNTAAAPGTFPVKVKVTDNSVPPLNASNTILVSVGGQIAVTNTAVLASSRNFQFTIQTPWTNSTFKIYATTNLGAAGWLPIFTNQTGPGGTLQFTDMLATNFPRRFYRAAFQ